LGSWHTQTASIAKVGAQGSGFGFEAGKGTIMINLIEEFRGKYYGDEPQPTGKEFDAQIGALQEVVAAKLPKDYIDFVRAYGGYAFETRLAFGVEKGRTSVDVLSGFTGGDAYDVIAQVERLELPEGLVPVLRDPGGNFVLVDVEDGTVLFYDHEADDADAEDMTLFPLADSLEEFVESWEPMEDAADDENR
jgi:hypothetical protein